MTYYHTQHKYSFLLFIKPFLNAMIVLIIQFPQHEPIRVVSEAHFLNTVLNMEVSS